MKKILTLVLTVTILAATLIMCGCGGTYASISGSKQDVSNTMGNANKLQANQPTPTDIDYSLERYNLIRRAYWVNGQREKANTLPCEIEKPLGYIVLFAGNAVVGNFVVDGKVSSLNSFLTPDSQWYEQQYYDDGDSKNGANNWIADVDGSYGENDNGIFFFTPDGKYVEYNGEYIYSDIPFEIDAPIVNIKEGN